MASSVEISKRRKLLSPKQQQPLLPGLPDHIAHAILSLVDPTTLYSVCLSWRRVIYTPSFPPFLSLYALLSSPSCPSSVEFYNFDPVSSKWAPLPPLPSDPPLRLSLRHPAFISRNLPIQSVSAAGNLVLLAATTENLFPALSQPLVFNPRTSGWESGPPLATPRRWCAAGALDGEVYVASGIGSYFSVDVARSVQKWDLTNKNDYDDNKWWSSSFLWEKVSSLKDGRFSREAIDAVGWRGKLCMVNVKGDALKDGLIYDAERDTWREMPEGMIAGWTGPVAAMDEDVMYVVDEGKGALKSYDPIKDTWRNIMESECLKGADQIAAGGGKVCVVCRGRIIVVDVAAEAAPRLREVGTPPGLEAVAINILPRMTM